MRLEKECGLPRDRRQLVEDRLLQWAQQDFLPGTWALVSALMSLH
jgi:hypothetical protein